MALASTPSGGKAEVLVALAHLGRSAPVSLVARKVRESKRATVAEVLTALQACASASTVSPSPSASTDRVALTLTGIAAARFPQPRPTANY